MKNARWLSALMVVFLLFCSTQVSAQRSKEQLKKENARLLQQIKKLNASLNANRSESKKSILYLKNLEAKISNQKQLLSNTYKEKRLLEDEIYLSQLEINKLRRELSKLKSEYKEVLVNAYKNKSLQNKIVFVLAAKSFTEAFRRVKYLEKYSALQGEKADEIKSKQEKIQKKIDQRKKAIAEKDNLLARQEVLKEQLEQQRQEQNNILQEYKKNESTLLAKIKQAKIESDRLDNEIQAIIAEEIRIRKEKERKEREERERLARLERERKAAEEARRKAEEAKRAAENKTNEKPDETKIAATPPPKEEKPVEKPVEKPAEKPKFSATAEAERLSSSFTSNRGKLPWPVANGQVVGKFGRQPHPLLPGIVENNAGVKIATQAGANARAAFEGEVYAVMPVQGGNKAVLVAHGDYFTVYNNLETVFVKKGQKVTTKQSLGRVYTDSDNNTILDFQVWKKTKKENPANWLTGM